MIQRILVLPKKRSFFLFGPRQVGKSTLIETLYTHDCWQRHLLLNDVYLSYAKNPSLFRREAEEKIRQGTRTIVVDEVQRLPILLNEVQYLMGKYPECQFILTGSSARKLKRGGANLLGGRALSYHLFPLVTEEIGELSPLEDLLKYGSLPPVVLAERQEKKDILFSYLETYLREEIQAEGIVRNLPGVAKFLDVAANQSGDLLNFTEMGRECQLGAKSVQSYYEILEDTLVGFSLPAWRKSIRKRLSTHPKFYLFDTGVTNALCRRLGAELDTFTQGKLFEQWIVLETHRLLRYFQPEAQMFYWRTSNGAEADLLVELHGKLIAAIEIKWSANVSGKHLSGLRTFHQEHPETKRYLVCTAPEPYELQGVTVLPWRQYLTGLKKWVE